MQDQSRRGFMGKAFGAVAGIGAVASLVAMKKTWDPLPSVVSAGFTTVDISSLEANNPELVLWRGKPVYILKFTNEMEADPKRTVKIGENNFIVMNGLCTHLGCIPAYIKEKTQFKCACHGGEYDQNGVNTFGPPPRPLDMVPFKIDGDTLVLGESGPEFETLLKAQEA